jgi:hypothetical protein
MLHAGEDDAGRDAGPDAVGDTQLPLGDQVPDVVRQPGPEERVRSAVPPVADPVVPLYQRVSALAIRQPREGHAHIPTMRTPRAGA